ncbi:MAG: hypothetical protein JXR91_17225 [Deltaproteobacteria bacterium]|nr:hypothetical protein [Deltaproteobacteria bacterium]
MNRFNITLIFILLLLPSIASAYMPSQRLGALEFRFGPHRPNSNEIIVNDPELSYENIFGKNESMFRFEIELDWQFARVPDIISFAVGGTIGYMHEKGKALYADPATGDMVKSSDTTTLNVFPMSLLAIIRVDVLKDKLGVPFSPYFKAGLDWDIWWTKTSGTTDNQGGTPGFRMVPGIALSLNWIDLTTSRTFDNEVGVNNSALFFEYIYERVDGFGDSGKLDLSPSNIKAHGTWMAGLLLEF